MKTIVHVHRQRIAQNNKAEVTNRQPPLIIRNSKQRHYANELTILGPCRIVYSPDKPLSCGAKVWIETDSAVEWAEVS